MDADNPTSATLAEPRVQTWPALSLAEAVERLCAPGSLFEPAKRALVTAFWGSH